VGDGAEKRSPDRKGVGEGGINQKKSRQSSEHGRIPDSAVCSADSRAGLSDRGDHAKKKRKTSLSEITPRTLQRARFHLSEATEGHPKQSNANAPSMKLL
jgi:hypothetical protein